MSASLPRGMKLPLRWGYDQASHGDQYCIMDATGRVYARTPGTAASDLEFCLFVIDRANKEHQRW